MTPDTKNLLPILLADPERVAEVPVGKIPALLVQLSALQGLLAVQLKQPSANGIAARPPAGDLAGASSPSEPNECYLSTHQLAERIPYAEKTIRNLKSEGAFREGNHYVKVRGRVMYYWPAMKVWVESGGVQVVTTIPLVRSKRRGR